MKRRIVLRNRRLLIEKPEDCDTIIDTLMYLSFLLVPLNKDMDLYKGDRLAK